MHHTPPQKQSEDESSDLWTARYVDKQQWDSHPDLPAAQKMHKQKSWAEIVHTVSLVSAWTFWDRERQKGTENQCVWDTAGQSE